MDGLRCKRLQAALINKCNSLKFEVFVSMLIGGASMISISYVVFDEGLIYATLHV